MELQPQTIAHADRLFELFQDEALYPFITRTPPKHAAEFGEGIRFISGRVSRDRKEYWLNWVSIQRQTRDWIGQIEISMEIETRIARLAYTTFREHWRKGYATEGCQRVIEHLFHEWKAAKIVIEMDVRNAASVALAESLGAERVAFTPKVQLIKGEWSDEYRYELVNSMKFITI